MIGIWLIAAPFIIKSYDDTADTWSTVVVGAVVAVAATAAEWLAIGERGRRPAMERATRLVVLAAEATAPGRGRLHVIHPM